MTLTFPTTITEIIMPGLIEPSGLLLQERPLSAPTSGQALVRVDASGVSFAEHSMRLGLYPGQPKFPFVPGYDFVGTVLAVGPGGNPELIGSRVAMVGKTGGWATHTLVDTLDLVPVPADLDPALVETVLVNGVTAWQMLHRRAQVKAGQTILVHGASGGVGTVLCQLARHAGIRVIGTAALRHHAALLEMGVEPIDYNMPDLAAHVRALVPSGVDAVFDHLGLDSCRASFSLLAPGGTLVSYGVASELRSGRKASLLTLTSVFVQLLSQLTLWNVLPNSRHASFYDFWAGHMVGRAAFRRRLHEDLTALLDLLSQKSITPHVAARFPLREAAAAMELAESRTIQGKVVIVP